MKRSLPVYSIETLRASDPAAQDFDLFRFEYFARDIAHLKTAHRHHFYTLIIITAGTGSHQIDFHNYELKSGRLFLIAPGQVHAWNVLKNTQGFVILFNESFIALSKGRKIMSGWPIFRPHQKCYFDLSTSDLTDWMAHIQRMKEELKTNDEFTRDVLFYSLCSLLVGASRLGKKANRLATQGQDFLFQYQELIEKHFVQLKKPKEYARLMNITPNYLNALCKTKSGKSAGELIRQRIILEAKRLLAHTSLTIAEVGYRLNFEDNSHFGKFFKSNSGTTPAEFRSQQVR